VRTLITVLVVAFIASMPRAPVPSDARAPDFTLTALDGRSVHLASLRGKIVLLNFWATWCAPCKVETPWFVDFSERYRADGLEVVGVSMDDSGRNALVARFVRDHNVHYQILVGNDAVADAYGGVRYLPQTFLIGRDGTIIKRIFGIQPKAAFEDDIRQAIKGRVRHAAGT
jgi:peroxiredoxin